MAWWAGGILWQKDFHANFGSVEFRILVLISVTEKLVFEKPAFMAGH
jgi:hypothetical protein